MRFLIMPLVLFCLLACGPTTSLADVAELGDASVGNDAGEGPDPCCCAFIREGDFDIISEDLRGRDECPTLDQGECVDPETIEGRFTPHPCCPDATGDRCGD